MIIAGKTVRFFRKHSERLLEYSKTAAISSFTVFAYTIGAFIILLTAFIYFFEPPSEVVDIATDLFLKSLQEVTAIFLFTLIIWKIDLLKFLSRIDPHNDHPVVDFLASPFLFLIGAVGLTFTLEQLDSMISAGTSDGLDLVLEIFLLSCVTSLAMTFAAITVNAGCRFLSNGLSGLLALRRIRDVPSIVVQWYRRHLTRLSYFVDSCWLVRAYAKENGVNPGRAVVQIFQYGLEQTEPINHTVLVRLNEDSDEPTEQTDVSKLD